MNKIQADEYYNYELNWMTITRIDNPKLIISRLKKTNLVKIQSLSASFSGGNRPYINEIGVYKFNSKGELLFNKELSYKEIISEIQGIDK